MTQQKSDARDYLSEYLHYYRKLHEPGFALLVTGEWGSGKTFQVRRALGADKIYYVSLFGLDSVERISAAAYASMYPMKAKAKSLLGFLGGASGEAAGIGLSLGQIPSALADAFLATEAKKDRVIVFDDLERSGLGAKDLLGVINRYVEHHKCRVVVIAHDGALSNELLLQKEKLFGQVIRVAAQAASAFPSFCAEIADPARTIIESYRDTILAVFAESEVHSLRILRHVMIDLARVIAALQEEYLRNGKLMDDMVRLFCALDIEVRATRLQEADLIGRRHAEIMYRVGKAGAKKANSDAAPPIAVNNDRYTSTDLTDELFSDDLLIDMLIRGFYDAVAINTAISKSHHLFDTRDTPPWRVVMSFDDLEDEQVAKGIRDMESQFASRAITDIGEMLHVFALRLLLARERAISQDMETIAAECRQYVDDLVSQNRLAPHDTNRRWRDEYEGAAHGYSFWTGDIEKFEALRTYVSNARRKVLEAQIGGFQAELLNTLRLNPKEFYDALCGTASTTARFGQFPVLAGLSPDEFIAAWKAAPHAGWKWISEALHERLNLALHLPEINSEGDWIVTIAKQWQEYATATPGLPGYRMRRAVPEFYRRKMGDVATAQATNEARDDNSADANLMD